MERPSNPQLDAIVRAANNLREMEALVIEAKRCLVEAVESLATVEDEANRLAAAVYAYWHLPETNANQLARLAVGKEASVLMLKRAGAVSIGVPCDRCGDDLAITSRAAMQRAQTAAAGGPARWAEGWRIVCDPCRDEVLELRREDRGRHEEACRDRRRVLAGLPYADYLETPDWSQRRDEALRNILHVRGELRCEVCPEREGLSLVHLRLDLPDRREELSLLCATCSTALASVGKLARAPLPANRMARLDLDAVERAFRIERGWEPA